MSSDWEIGRLRDIAEVVMGQSPSAQFVNEICQGLPLLNGPTEFGSMYPSPVQFTTDVRKKAMAGDLLFCVRGSTTGRMNWADQEYAIGRGLAAIRHQNGNSFQSFLRATIELKLPELLAAATGSTFPNVGRDQLLDITVSIPPEDEQKRISGFFKCLDDKIEVNRRINQTLEAMAQAIFKSWFVDFDPVKAKIAAIAQGQDPLRAAMRTISGKTDAELDQMHRDQYDQLAATAALFPDAMQESELGEIPKGWTHCVLGDVCNFTAGSAFKPEHQGSAEGDYPFIKVSDMNLAGNEVFIHSANNYVSKSQQAEMKAKLHPIGATVFAKIGVALISNRRRLLTTPTIIDNNLMSASPIEGKSGAYYLYSILSTIDFNSLVSGTALPYLNVSDLKKIPIVHPSHDVGCAFERKASSIFSMMQALAAQSSTIEDIRGNLLPKLLSGEVELSETLEG